VEFISHHHQSRRRRQTFSAAAAFSAPVAYFGSGGATGEAQG